jgi:hypothetical protein
VNTPLTPLVRRGVGEVGVGDAWCAVPDLGTGTYEDTRLSEESLKCVSSMISMYDRSDVPPSAALTGRHSILSLQYIYAPNLDQQPCGCRVFPVARRER